MGGVGIKSMLRSGEGVYIEWVIIPVLALRTNFRVYHIYNDLFADE